MEIKPTQDTINVNAQEAKVKMVAIIRDPDGNVRHDDVHNVSQEVLNSKDFTPSDLEYLNKLRNQ